MKERNEIPIIKCFPNSQILQKIGTILYETHLFSFGKIIDLAEENQFDCLKGF